MTIDTEIAAFVTEIQAMLEDHFSKTYKLVPTPTIRLDQGRRYARIVVDGSAFRFVDRTNGNILKAASWKAPAEHARGNVLRSDRMNSVTPYGVVYLR